MESLQNWPQAFTIVGCAFAIAIVFVVLIIRN